MEAGKLPPVSKITFVLLLIISFLSIRVSTPELSQPVIKAKTKPLLQIDSKKLSDGDLIFREGYDLISRLVLSQGDSAQFSHVGVILKNEEK